MDLLDDNQKQPADNGKQDSNANTTNMSGGAFTFDMPFSISASNALGENLTEHLKKNMATALKQIAVGVGVDAINVDSLFIAGAQVGANADAVVLYTNTLKGKVLTYIVTVSEATPTVTPPAILAELTGNRTAMGGRAPNPLAPVRLVGQNRLLNEVETKVKAMRGNVNVTHLELLDVRSIPTAGDQVVHNIARNFVEVLISEMIGGSTPTTVADILHRYNPQSLTTTPRLAVTQDAIGTTVNDLGMPVRTDWKIGVQGVGAYNTTTEMIRVAGYNDLVPVNTVTPQNQPVVRFAPNIIMTSVDLPSGAASDLGAILLAVSTMNTMASGSLAIAPFMRMRDSKQRDPMAMEIITHALEQAGINPNKNLPKSVDASQYYSVLMKHMTPDQVARTIDMTEHTTMATMCSVLLEAAIEQASNEVGSGARRVYDAINHLTGGAYDKVTGGKDVPVFSTVYTQPAGYIKTRSGEALDIRAIDVLSILTKKRQDNSSFNHPELAVQSLLSDVRRNENLGYWAAVMNIMAPQAEITGLTYRSVFNPAFINALTSAVNSSGFMPAILPGDFITPGMIDTTATFNTGGWVNNAVPFGGGITTPNDYTRI